MSTRVNIAIGAVVTAVLLVFVAMNLWLGTLVQTAIVEIGSRLTKTTVTLEDVHIGLLHGLVQLDGLEIGNPPGFTATRAVRLDTVRVRLDLRSVLSDTVIIDEILVEESDVTFEGLMPKPGRYRAWTQFRRHDRVYTFTFTFNAVAANTVTER